MLEMSIESIRVSLMNYQRVVILKEKHADRYLPIWIGPAEAESIAVKLQDISVPRPLTHDLLGSVVAVLGARVHSVLVSDLQNDTFFAKIILELDGRTLEVDSRPSDAIALAVRAKVPIFATETVLEKAGVTMDKDAFKADSDAANRPVQEKPLKEEDLRKLSAFREVVNELDLEDFGKSGSKG